MLCILYHRYFCDTHLPCGLSIRHYYIPYGLLYYVFLLLVKFDDMTNSNERRRKEKKKKNRRNSILTSHV